MRKMSISTYFLLLAGTITAPILLFLALLLTQLQISDRAEVERRTLRSAKSSAVAVEQVLQSMTATLKLVSSAPELAAGDLKAFHNRAQLALAESGTFVIVVAEDGQQLVNTRFPFSATLPKIAGLASLKEAVATDKTVTSDVFVGKASGLWVFNVVQPLPVSSNSLARAVILTKNADSFRALIAQSTIPEGWHAVILDGSNNVISANDEKLYPVGKQAADLAGLDFTRDDALVYGDFGAPNVLMAHSPVGQSRWKAVVWGPLAAALPSILQSWRLLIFSGFGCLLFAGTVGYFAAKHLRVSILKIANLADEVGHGRSVAPLNTRIQEFDTVGNILSAASMERTEAERQIRFVMRELVHRTKNLMTVVLSMIRQTARNSLSVDGFRVSLEERIFSLSRSLDLLTAKDWGGVSLRQLMDMQLASFVDTAGKITIEGEDVLLKADIVQNLGMVIHELATNSVKHGSLHVRNGKVSVSWTVLMIADGPPQLELNWREIGGPPAQRPDRKGFGTQIIERHAPAVFGGKVNLSYGPSGFSWSLVAPVESFSATKSQSSNYDTLAELEDVGHQSSVTS